MIKTVALKKVAKFLESKKITSTNFSLVDGEGFLKAWKIGCKFEIRIKHDDAQVRIIETKTRYL